MNRIIALLVLLLAFRFPLQAQDAALVERVNKLNVYVEELMADKARQQKQIADLIREVESLRDQLAKATGGASQQDLAALADSIKEVDRKRQQDKELILSEIEKLGKTVGSRVSARSSPGADGAGTGYEYVIQQGDTLLAIVQAYNKKLGLKLTVEDVLEANPGLKARSMPVGRKIIIPER